MRERQRLQEHSVDEAVDGGGGSDAEGQGEDGGKGEARRFTQLAQSKVEVGAQGGEHSGGQRSGSNLARVAVRSRVFTACFGFWGMFLVTTHRF